jgi:ABC-type phosphonate transport system ATPase subunit
LETVSKDEMEVMGMVTLLSRSYGRMEVSGMVTLRSRSYDRGENGSVMLDDGGDAARLGVTAGGNDATRVCAVGMGFFGPGLFVSS